jgi:two-component system response regulator DesR
MRDRVQLWRDLVDADPDAAGDLCLAIVRSQPVRQKLLASLLRLDLVPPRPVTPRELEVLRCLSNGMVNREAAWMLGVAEKTVQQYVDSAVSKLCAKNRTHAVAVAIRERLI